MTLLTSSVGSFEASRTFFLFLFRPGRISCPLAGPSSCPRFALSAIGTIKRPPTPPGPQERRRLIDVPLSWILVMQAGRKLDGGPQLSPLAEVGKQLLWWVWKHSGLLGPSESSQTHVL